MFRTACLTLLAALACAAPAAADDTVLAPATGAAGLSASGGQVVFSRHDANGTWSLMRWHDGALDALPVASRSVPFDADVGTDAQGAPVVVYSRCATDPEAPQGLQPAPDWQTARGCDVYELPLTGTMTERKLTAVSSASKSETTPSMWRGAVAFARHRDGASAPAVEYLPAGSTHVRVLGGGSVQACDGRGCTAAASHDDVDQLDLGPTRAAFVWRMTGGGTYGVGVSWELRSAPLSGGPSALLDAGLISGACGFRLPSAPTALSTSLAYLEASAPCDQTTTRFAVVDPRTGIESAAPTPGGLAAGAVRDGDTLYWLRAPAGANDAETAAPGAATCTRVACELVRSTLPAYARQPVRRVSPEGDIDLVRSGLGYRWATVAGVRVLRPPAHVPCSPSASSARVYASAQWSRGRHTVRAYRDGHRFGSTITRSLPTGAVIGAPRLAHCGDRLRLTYSVDGRRVSFTAARNRP